LGYGETSRAGRRMEAMKVSMGLLDPHCQVLLRLTNAKRESRKGVPLHPLTNILVLHFIALSPSIPPSFQIRLAV